MLLLTKIVHVLAVGLWFGAAVFFTFVVGLSLFGTFDQLAGQQERPLWFPLPPELDKPRPSDHFPDPLRSEQGSRVAGAAVGPMFPWYYGIQAGCGVLALATALVWFLLSVRLTANTVRVVILVLALVTVGLGWWMERVVSELRGAREEKSDLVLRSDAPSQAEIQTADAARAEFGRWHGYSLLVNFATLFLVTLAMALAAVLPAPVAAPLAARFEDPATQARVHV
jgi:hypothetical protein